MRIPVQSAEFDSWSDVHGRHEEEVLPEIQCRTPAGSFYTDCDRFSGSGHVVGRVRCAKIRDLFARRTMMDRLPLDRNCDHVYFVMDRESREWHKCCTQGGHIRGLLGMSNIKCTRVVPTGWFPARDASGEELPFKHDQVQECFRTALADHADGNECHCAQSEEQEQCVRLGGRGKRASWPMGRRSRPSVSVFMFELPSPSILAAIAALEPPDRRCLVSASFLGNAGPLKQRAGTDARVEGVCCPVISKTTRP
mmetsp:Transcript_61029/g.162012  ORF Transcript_61029/g.162012 Transcript_61029/m.162012 type:complete len:253 (-) Transcript_61029:58-816(-)